MEMVICILAIIVIFGAVRRKVFWLLPYGTAILICVATEPAFLVNSFTYHYYTFQNFLECVLLTLLFIYSLIALHKSKSNFSMTVLSGLICLVRLAWAYVDYALFLDANTTNALVSDVFYPAVCVLLIVLQICIL